MRFAFLICLFSIFSCFAIDYEVHDLEIIAESSVAKDINDKDEIIGELVIDGKTQFFLWSPEKQLTILDKIPEGATVRFINNKSQIAGDYLEMDGLWWDPKKISHGFLLDPVTDFHDLGTLNGKPTWVRGLDDEGNILLCDETTVKILQNDKSFIKVNLKKVAWWGSWPGLALNKSGSFAFSFQASQDGRIGVGRKNILKLDDVYLKEIPTNVFVCDINNLNTVASVSVKGKKYNGVIWFADDRIEIIPYFVPNAISDANCVVGSLCNEKGQTIGPGIWENGILTDLNESLKLQNNENSSFESIDQFYKINNSGKIVGTAVKYGKVQACLLIPKSTTVQNNNSNNQSYEKN